VPLRPLTVKVLVPTDSTVPAAAGGVPSLVGQAAVVELWPEVVVAAWATPTVPAPVPSTTASATAAEVNPERLAERRAGAREGGIYG
jgi:hypothetical protein